LLPAIPIFLFFWKENSAHQLKPANLFLWNWKADRKAFGKYIGPLEYRNR